MINSVIFDLDGTLIDSSEDILRCLSIAYGNQNIEINRKLNSNLIGPPLDEIINQLSPNLPSEKTQSIISDFRDEYLKSNFKLSKAYPGVFELLEYLKMKSIHCFIATNKTRKMTQELLRVKNLDHYFKDICCKGDGNLSTKTDLINFLITKWNLDHSTTLMVGDSTTDITSANNCGIKSIAHLGGYGLEEELLLCHASFYVQKMSQIQDILLNI